ncbi:MAG: PD-(D/E)XK nuclease family protein [Castellaniella sp.]
MSTTSKLLHEVDTRLRVLREAKERLRGRYAPDFRLYDFLVSDENGLSRILASLLSPNGRHGQDALYLELFLDRLPVPEPWWNGKDLLNTIVKCEVSTVHNRRIDIVIDIPGAGKIGIENKPWAVDQKDQLADYAEHLSKSVGGWMLIYLANSEPDESSIEDTVRENLEREHKFRLLDFDAIHNWLESCLMHTRPPNVRVFIEEIMHFVDEKINGRLDMSAQEEVIKEIKASPANLAAAFAIRDALVDVKGRLMLKLIKDLERLLRAHQMRLIWTEDKLVSKRGFAFQIYFWSDEGQEICPTFEFQSSDCRDFSWGMRRSSRDYYSSEQWREINKAVEDVYGPSSSTTWWPWILYANKGMKANYRDWSISEPWESLASDDAFAQNVVEIAVRLKEAFADRKHLLFQIQD